MQKNHTFEEEVFRIRSWQAGDDHGLRLLMGAHMERDSGWPPAHTRETDPAAWLAGPATIGRWVAVGRDGTPVGHIGLGSMKAGPCRDALQAALDCGPGDMAEICRTVVHPEVRGRGLAGQLTRAALREAIGGGLFPVSTVLSNRGSWLDMMLSTNWREVCRTPSEAGNCDLVALLPPQKLVDAVRQHRERQP